MQELLKNETEHFDLAMVEFALPPMAAVAVRFECPLIQLFSLDAPSYSYQELGNVAHPVLNPDFSLGYTGKLSFLQRLISSLSLLFMKYWYALRLKPVQEKLIKTYFGNDYPTLDEILHKTSLAFVYSDNVFYEPRPLLPNIIQFGGGTHLTTAKPLPKNLQTQLDKAKNGFIYFSLGSNIKSERLSESIQKVFLDTFAELPYLILWKFEKEELPGKPDNVIISKWFPQQDVLRHPNIKLFISQGGLQSTEEAIYNYVPIVGIPFFGDQEYNIRRMVNKSIAVLVDRNTMDKTTLKEAILEVAVNPSYRENVKNLGELVRDEPMTGIERAVWWTEYVIRHKGASHLRSPAMDLPTYQYYFLDVIGFCLIVILVVTYILFKMLKLLKKFVTYCITKSKVKTE